MIPLPDWAIPFLNNQNCPHCKAESHCNGVVGIGIRQKDFDKKDPGKGDYVLTFEYVCPSCSKKSLWIADPDDSDADLVDILTQIIEINSNPSMPSEAQNKVSGSKISNREIEELKRALYSSGSYEEFLEYLGIDPETDNGKH
jgi:hypothetical protein